MASADVIEALLKAHVIGYKTLHKVAEARKAKVNVGINYYGRYYVKFDIMNPTKPKVLLHDPAAMNEPFNDLGWASYRKGQRPFGGNAQESRATLNLDAERTFAQLLSPPSGPATDSCNGLHPPENS